MKHNNYFLRIFNALLVFFVILSFCAINTERAVAAPPSILSYQGRLTNSAGNVLGGSGTTFYFRFSIWNSATGGTKLWPTSDPTAYAVTVREGLFSVNIGDIANGYPDALDYSFSSQNVYLDVAVSSDGTVFETLTPRQQITSSAFALVAGTVNGTGLSTFGGFISSASSTVSGNLNAGNLSATGNSSISGNLNVTGDSILAEATTTNLFSNIGSFDSLCLFGDCQSSWPVSGGSSASHWATSSLDVLAIHPASALSVGIGTTSPFAKLSVHAASGETFDTLFAVASSPGGVDTTQFNVSSNGMTTIGDSSGTGDANFQFASDPNAWSIGYNSSDKSFRIASSTNLTDNVALSLAKSGAVTLSSGIPSSNNSNYLCINTSTYAVTRNTACDLSSGRFKENIKNLTYDLSDIMSLRPVTFTYRPEMNMGASKKIGFIAEEVALLFPEIVSYDASGLPSGLDYAKLTPILVRAIQELNLKLDSIASITADGIVKLFAREVYTNKLCIKKSDGSDVCVMGDEFAKFLDRQ